MPRSKILATYDGQRMLQVMDQAIAAGPAGLNLAFMSHKHANNFMLDFYGFRNAMWIAIDKHKRMDLQETFVRLSRIKITKSGSSLLFLDRAALAEYKQTEQTMDTLTIPQSAVSIKSVDKGSQILQELGFVPQAEPQDTSNSPGNEPLPGAVSPPEEPTPTAPFMPKKKPAQSST